MNEGSMRFSMVRSCIVALFCLPYLVGNTCLAQASENVHKVTTTTVESQTVTVTESYVCKIHAKRQITVRALDKGYLKTIAVKEGQTVKQGDLLFEMAPIEEETQENAKAVQLLFCRIKAPFGGIVGRMAQGEGGLVLEGETLTGLSDASVVWVYFNVPETRYLKFMNQLKKKTENPKFELVLTNGKKFEQTATLGAIDAQFNSETGTIAFRVDIPNPEGLLRHGQRGVMLMSQLRTDAIVVPQKATFEKAEKRYVYVVDKADVVHQCEIVIQDELENLFVIQTGVGIGDRIVLEGISQVHDGEKIEFVDH
jgi:membrane fusion protein (multidrug efflux system)